MTKRNIALGFLAVLALVVAALVVTDWKQLPLVVGVIGAAGTALYALFAQQGERGAVTVTYRNVGSGTTPPTAIAARRVNSVVATIAASADADAAAIVTHNMNLSAADLAAGWPTVLFEPLSTQFQTSRWFAVSHDPNYVGLVKGNAAGGGAAGEQLKVTVARPHTIVR